MAAFASNPGASAVTAQPLPPLPDLNRSGGGQQQTGPGQGIMSALLSGVAPVKASVDQITKACQMIVKLGMVPGAEQICADIVAKATSMLPLAAQAALMPMGGGGGQGPQMSLPPGAPPPPMGAPPPPPGAGGQQ